MCTLKLTFAHASLLLYRPFVLYSIGQDHDHHPSQKMPQWIQNCQSRSIDAAKVVVQEYRSPHRRGLFSRVFWLVNYVQFAALGTMYLHCYLVPNNSDVRVIAEDAMAGFHVGVEGDLVGEKYLEIVKEIRQMPTRSDAPRTNDPSAAHTFETAVPLHQFGEDNDP